MNTLDEVIKAFDNWMPDCDSCVFYCDIYGENNCTIADALHYLKAFRDAKNALDAERERTIEAYCQWKDAREKLEAQTSQMMWVDKHFQFEISDNPVLTWDELRTMEGKPVWVEEKAENGLWWTYWVIWEGENAVLPKEKYGTDWQAYRKERHENA